MMTSLTCLMSIWSTSAILPSTKTQPPKNILASQSWTCSAAILSSQVCIKCSSMLPADEMTWSLCSICSFIYLRMGKCQDFPKKTPLIPMNYWRSPSKLKWTKHPRTSASIIARTYAPSRRRSSATVSNRCQTTEASARFYEIWEIKKSRLNSQILSKS